MVSNSRPSRRAKDDENSNSKGRQSSDKGLSTSSSAASETNGLRRSSRETLLAKKSMVTESSPIRKSKRIEKRSPKTWPAGTTPEKKWTPSPLRRSDRGKSSLSTSTGSKKSTKSSSSLSKKKKKKEKKKKSKKERSVTQLTLETEEVSRSEEEEVQPAKTKKKCLKTSAYKALFQKPSKKVKAAVLEHTKKQEKEEKLSQGDSNNSRGELDGIDESSERNVGALVDQDAGGVLKRNLVVSDSGLCTPIKGSTGDNEGGKEASSSSMRPGCRKATSGIEDNHILRASGIGKSGMPLFPDTMAEKTNVEPEKLPMDCEVEKEKEPELVHYLSNAGTSKDRIGLKSGQEIISSSRKRIMLDADSNTIRANASKRICTSDADATPLLPSECTRSSPVEKCGESFKGKRVDLDSTREGLLSCNTNLSREFVPPSLNKDRGEREASISVGLADKCDSLIQQKESPRDLQTDSWQYTCFTCKLGGKLLCCEGSGCTRSYHLSCLDPPMDEVPLGVWYCLMCVKKKLESGVHSVSEGVESIWDAKEVNVLDVDGLRKEREFFVKYKGLAHIHNRWVPESKLLLDASSLVAKFNRKSQVINWKQEWTVPQRLVQKRLLMSPKQRDLYNTEHAGKELDSHYEWLVKWRGLDYEHATWELDSDSLFKSPDGQGLVTNYENRRKRVNGASFANVDKILEGENCSSDKLSQLQSGLASGSDSNFQDYINKLHEFWRKGQNAVVIDEQVNERIMKVISLVQSFQPNTCGPFLIISTSAALHLWDVEFLQLAPWLNVVVYSGNKDLRNSVRKLEFYAEGGCIIFQVLITTLEIILEDLDVLRCIEWELIIIDEAQRTRISSHCAQIKLLATERRLLVVNCQLKENTTEYSNLLSLLESSNDSSTNDSRLTSSSDNIGKLKEKLLRYIVYQFKSDCSRFKEYWVPVQMSNLQLEQYCATLISNSAILCSSHKSDSAGVLRDVLMSSRKCCDHPYIVDKNTPVLLSKGLQESEYLGFGIKASGKFQFLDMMLLELKKQGLRALILFQEFGKESIGDLLDDFLRQRFGQDSFERVVAGLQPAKKQTALNKFNNKESGRFVFLIETRACLSSIKLSSVNTVIIFGSDWNPMSDVRALQKISLDPPSEQIPVFRLYSSFTLEEKVLCLAKQGKILDGNLQSIGWGTSHMLLMWGASHQFQTLDKFHRDTVTAFSANSLTNNSYLENSVQELLQIISSNGKDTESRSSSVVLTVQKIGGAYRTESLLLGELESQVTDEGKPHNFWTKLLGGKHPHWKYISGSSQRNRKKVQYFETEAASDEVVRKRRKVVNSVDPPSQELGSAGKTVLGCKEEALGTVSLPRSPVSINGSVHENCASTSPLLDDNFLEAPPNYNFETEERRKLHDAQKSLHLSLKPGISKLCKLLKLTGNTEDLVKQFLEYMVNNHYVSSDSPTTIQAFQISLCWTVASLLKLKIDHRESIALARQHLNFNCRKDEAEFAYSMLRCFKTVFAYRTGKLNAEFISSSGLAPEFSLAQKDALKCINQIQKKSEKRLNKLIQKQQEQKNTLMRSYEEDKLQIQNKLRMEKTVICACFEDNSSIILDKIKLAESSFAKEVEELENKRNMCLKNLESEQLAARRMVQERGARWVEAVKSWACRELFGTVPVNETFPWLGCSQANEEVMVEDNSNDGLDDVVSVNPPSLQKQLRNGMTMNVPEKEVQRGGPEMLGSSNGVQNHVSGDRLSFDDLSPDITAPRAAANEMRLSVPGNEDQLVVPEMLVSSDGVQNPVSGDETSLEDQIAETTSVTVAVDNMHQKVPETLSCCDGLVGKLPDTATINVGDAEIPLSDPESSHHEVEVDHHSEENSELHTLASNSSIGIDQQNGLNNAVNESSLQELSQVNSSSVQPAIALDNDDPLPPNQASQDELTLPSTPPTGDQQIAAAEVEGLGSQPVDTSPNQHVHEAIFPEPIEQANHLPSSNSPSSSNSYGATLIEEIEHQPGNDDRASSQVSQSPTELFENAPPVSNQPIFQPLTFSSPPPNGIPIGPLGLHLSDLRTTPIAYEFNNRSGLSLPAMHSFVPLPLCHNPLQKELERLSKEYELTSKSHEDRKLQLKSDRDKEIEEFFAQLNRKYELKHQEIEADFSSKKKEFDERHSKVMMNKILSDAFRTKCMEIKPSGRLGMQQDANGNLMQHPVQLQTQQNAQRPPLVSASSAGSPAASLQTPTPECTLQTTARVQLSMQQNTQRPLPVGASLACSPAASLQTPAPERTPQTTALPAPAISARDIIPPAQGIRPSSNVFPTPATRPPQIGSVSYSNSTQQGGGEIRSRPPHLRNSAPAVSIPPHQRGMPTQPANFAAPPSSTLPSLPTPPQLPTATYPSRPVDRTLGPDTSRELPSIPNLQSALELLRGTERQAAASSSVSFPSLADWVLNPIANQLNTSESSTGGTQVNQGSKVGPTDVVYLSDDD